MTDVYLSLRFEWNVLISMLECKGYDSSYYNIMHRQGVLCKKLLNRLRERKSGEFVLLAVPLRKRISRNELEELLDELNDTYDAYYSKCSTEFKKSVYVSITGSKAASVDDVGEVVALKHLPVEELGVCDE